MPDFPKYYLSNNMYFAWLSPFEYIKSYENILNAPYCIIAQKNENYPLGKWLNDSIAPQEITEEDYETHYTAILEMANRHFQKRTE